MENIIQYNQTKNACGPYSGLGCISDLTGESFDRQEQIELMKMAKSYGFSLTYGMYLKKASELLVDFFNNKFDRKIKRHYVKIGDKNFYKALDNGFSIHTGFNGNDKFNKDMYDNGIIDSISFGESTYGHMIRLKKINEQYCLINNRYGSKPINIFKIKDLNGLIKGGNWFNSGYYYTLEDTNFTDTQKIWIKTIRKLLSPFWDRIGLNKTRQSISKLARHLDILLK